MLSAHNSVHFLLRRSIIFFFNSINDNFLFNQNESEKMVEEDRGTGKSAGSSPSDKPQEQVQYCKVNL